MRVLVLGGTGEGKRLAQGLTQQGHEATYSVADPDARADVPGPVRRGGFGGVDGLVAGLAHGGFELLIDATHPYAAGISANARQASEQTRIPLWAVRRPPWEPGPDDDWTFLPHGVSAREAAAGLRRPLFTVGPAPLDEAPVPGGQHWIVRCLPGHGRSEPASTTILAQRGPFGVEDERALFALLGVDGLITKNSGGSAVAAKLVVARELDLPVRIEARPNLPVADREFQDPETLLDALAGRGHKA